MGSRPSWHQALWAAVLWGGERSAISHRAAAALYELDECAPGPVELTVDLRASRRARGLRIHRSDWRSVETRRIDGLTVTAPELTLCDVGRTASFALLDDLVESGLRLGLTTPERVQQDRHPAGIGRRSLDSERAGRSATQR